tara:strand:- start:467 stop:1393 length:927 start_codon:yes stop_codon:yes gene_type:complete
MSQISACLNKVKKPCYRFISTQEISSEKFKNKDKMLRSFLIPVCFWMAKKVKKNKTMIVGLSGGQGTGKTTISSIIKIILEKYFKLNVFKISIDDFYKTRKERIILSKKVHPLLKTRGVPGTHDIDMMLNLFRKVKAKKLKSLSLPKFDKSIDDRLSKNKWYKVKSKPDIVIFEGWCVGAKSQSTKQLIKPINSLERFNDKSMKWRKYVNLNLKNKYKKFHSMMDCLLYLKAENFALLRKWRLVQEKKLKIKNKNKKNSKVMNKQEVLNFMMTYQRITEHMFKTTTKYSSIVMSLNGHHQITKLKYNK